MKTKIIIFYLLGIFSLGFEIIGIINSTYLPIIIANVLFFILIVYTIFSGIPLIKENKDGDKMGMCRAKEFSEKLRKSARIKNNLFNKLWNVQKNQSC